MNNERLIGKRNLLKAGAVSAVFVAAVCVERILPRDSALPESSVSTPIAEPLVLPDPEQVAGKPIFYSGALRELKGKKLMEQGRLNAILQSLYDTKYPLLQKIARDINLLTQLETGHGEFLPWVKHSLPLPITYDSPEDKIVLWIRRHKDNPENLFYVDYNQDGLGQLQHREIETLTLGINVKPSELPGESGVLEEGVKLASLFVREMLLLKNSFEFYALLRKYGLATITDLEDNEITDAARQLRAGGSAYFHQLMYVNNDYWRVFQAAPLFLISLAFDQLVQAEKLPKDSDELNWFIKASGQIQQFDVGREVQRLSERFSQTKNLLPPDGTMEMAHTGSMLTASGALCEQLWPAVGKPGKKDV